MNTLRNDVFNSASVESFLFEVFDSDINAIHTLKEKELTP